MHYSETALQILELGRQTSGAGIIIGYCFMLVSASLFMLALALKDKIDRFGEKMPMIISCVLGAFALLLGGTIYGINRQEMYKIDNAPLAYIANQMIIVEYREDDFYVENNLP